MGTRAADSGGQRTEQLGPEISDLIVAFAPDTLARLPVQQEAAASEFDRRGNPWAARIVRALPADDGILDPAAVDRLLVAVHAGIQGISEEFSHGLRVAALLRPLLSALRQARLGGNVIRVVDIGCGTGYVIRWLAAFGKLGPDVELLGADYNAALIAEAARLAECEALPCTFAVANAFGLAQPADVLLSTGVLHHFQGDALTEFFGHHAESGASGFLHFDFQPSPFAPPGAWVFHALRARLALARHDGVLSARRVHSGRRLRDAAQAGASGFQTAVYSARAGAVPLPPSFHTLVGLRPVLVPLFTVALGPAASRLTDWNS